MINTNYFKNGMFEKIVSFLEDYSDNLERYEKVNFDRLKKSVLSKSEGFIVSEKNEEVLGLIHIEDQDWDSNHFGLKFAKINLIIAKGSYSEKIDCIKYLLEKVDEKGYEYVILRWNSKDLAVIHSLESAGYQFIIDSIVLIHNLKNLNELNTFFEISSYQEEDISTLQEIARNTFKFDRFHADSKLNEKKCDFLHSKWVSNCCKGKLADKVFVAKVDGKIAGFNACRIDNDNKIGTIILTGVSSKFRKKGIGQTLVNAVLNFFKDNNLSLADVRTELNNIPAIRLYQKSGYNISLVEKYYRKFKKS